MADLLAYPLDDTKRYRLARAASAARTSRDARTIGFCVELLDDLMASRPGTEGEYPALALVRWMTDANALLNSIKLEPAQVRMDTSVTERCLQLKGLVSEAELHCLPTMDLARAENDALAERLIGNARDEAKRTPCAALTSGLVSDNLRFPAGHRQSGWPVFEHETASRPGPSGGAGHGAAGPVPHSAGRRAVRLALAGLAAALLARLRAMLPDPLAGLFHETRRSPHARNPVKNPKNNNAGFTTGTIAPPLPRVMRKNRDDFHATPLGTPFGDGSAA